MLNLNISSSRCLTLTFNLIGGVKISNRISWWYQVKSKSVIVACLSRGGTWMERRRWHRRQKTSICALFLSLWQLVRSVIGRQLAPTIYLSVNSLWDPCVGRDPCAIVELYAALFQLGGSMQLVDIKIIFFFVFKTDWNIETWQVGILARSWNYMLLYFSWVVQCNW
jgi:hypothetical protein